MNVFVKIKWVLEAVRPDGSVARFAVPWSVPREGLTSHEISEALKTFVTVTTGEWYEYVDPPGGVAD